MILVSEKMMTPRTVDVITLIDKDGHYIYVSRNIYDSAIIFDYNNQSVITDMEKSVLGQAMASKVNPDLLDIAMILYSTVPDPLGMMVPFMLLADKIEVPKNLSIIESKMFGYNLIDAVTSSIDVRSYVKLPEAMRAPLVGLHHIANTYKDRVEHAMGMWFTGVELVQIREVEIVKSNVYNPATMKQAVSTSIPATAPVKEDESKPLPIPAGSITTVPAPDKESAEPQANTISEEAYAALMKRLSKINEETDADLEELSAKKDAIEVEETSQKKVEVDMETADRAGISALFNSMIKKQ